VSSTGVGCHILEKKCAPRKHSVYQSDRYYHWDIIRTLNKV